MAKFALIGNPIAHSKSPALFKAAYPGSHHTYSLLEAPTCREAMERFTQEGYSGCNVTSPFKDEVMQYVSLPDKISSTIGSANTIICKEGKLYSYNTDYYGVKETLADFFRNTGYSFKSSTPTAPAVGAGGTGKATALVVGAGGAGKAAALVVGAGGARKAAALVVGAGGTGKAAALVVGAGGAGKAAALAVRDMGMEVFLANRSSDAAAPYAARIGAEYIPLEKIPLVLPQTGIIIYNLSMEIPQLKNADLAGKVVFEANYAHPNLASSNASCYISGRYWLYNQAIPAYRLFTSEEPCTCAMRQVIGL